MTTLDWFAIGTFALLVLLFYWARAIPVYVSLAAVLVGGFAVVTGTRMGSGRFPEWAVATSGLLLCAFGLLIVRTMLIRSVSLQLLARIDGDRETSFGEDIATRLHDMRAFSLIRTRAGKHELTGFGRLIAVAVAVCYSLFRLET